jgi:hypothetical protein
MSDIRPIVGVRGGIDVVDQQLDWRIAKVKILLGGSYKFFANRRPV